MIHSIQTGKSQSESVNAFKSQSRDGEGLDDFLTLRPYD